MSPSKEVISRMTYHNPNNYYYSAYELSEDSSTRIDDSDSTSTVYADHNANRTRPQPETSSGSEEDMEQPSNTLPCKLQLKIGHKKKDAPQSSNKEIGSPNPRHVLIVT